ncbi:DNA polymerase III subunit epsilon [Enterobacteriaceae endosymbiont of Donacia bicoloricornis]|uniref:DNA polymerase III subunit epsilon n=1 Tax=Enterobacteriaceae endosymbiont of Donacia bicoloricornis TaxID=2675772 RepID=UPI001448C182|nr:DNA polymerase III subunit epsilon [Enterobacteriaceae endosymbiont of Donacia bicoloricornis]QJC37663.1 DNA polymerase III subunit epsilon [Enterobacteriaceae endosymbiont of Donacia bicoloricornis]
MKKTNIRQVVLDTETTGMNLSYPYYIGHRIIEIGIIEIINRNITQNYFHTYINPQKIISKEAFSIHGISNKFLSKKPIFSDILDNFLNFIKGAELIIHNAQFDINFLNYELSLLKKKTPKIEDICIITDTLKIARNIFPGKRNSLNSLCNRFNINISKRNLHGALLDAKLLAHIFLFMTTKQNSFQLEFLKEKNSIFKNKIKFLNAKSKIKKTLVINASKKELKLHQLQLNLIKNKYGFSLWENKNK